MSGGSVGGALQANLASGTLETFVKPAYPRADIQQMNSG